MLVVKLVQEEFFSKEIENLANGKAITKKSNLKMLDPFLGSGNLLRVGGKLRNATIEYDIPTKSDLTKLIILHEHFRQLHAGPQAILDSVRQRFWPIHGRLAVRSVFSKCLVCFKVRLGQKMGDLPADRITPNRPFYVSGTDIILLVRFIRALTAIYSATL
ncbi:hypothetical protein NQ315_011022 [Exocentrus adspersus]|uniref:Integrase zinc-binding domain-containing protein n=1 Tax=Exocentrus adspersus TaxID=1586481 RepID=A0AAV8VK23_9CUCU|nr:hypothetical protein NQ315_011022 [Exocentrus adspersus]